MSSKKYTSPLSIIGGIGALGGIIWIAVGVRVSQLWAWGLLMLVSLILVAVGNKQEGSNAKRSDDDFISGLGGKG